MTLTRTALMALAISTFVSGAEKPRVFITESPAAQASGDSPGGEGKGSLEYSGGTSPQSVEVIKAFSKNCRDAVVTSNRAKADFVIRFDHEALNPATPFVHGNKVAVFNKNEDLIYSDSSRLLNNAVKGACAAISDHSNR